MDRTAPLNKPQPDREWVPTCFLLVHSPFAKSTIRYSPMHIQRAADVSYHSRVSIYGRSPVEPIWTRESGAMHLDDIFAIDSTEIASDLGVDTLFHYGEAFQWSPEMPPPTPNIAMPLHLHYTSSDGSMYGHLASFFIFGAPRSVERGDFYYESFPCARIDKDHDFSAYIINPFLRASMYQVSVVGERGVLWTSDEMSIRGKGAAEWRASESTFKGCEGPVGVIVKSRLKTTSFFATRNGQGRMIGLDHGHPFLAHVMDHRR